jgi:hypothetical protein
VIVLPLPVPAAYLILGFMCEKCAELDNKIAHYGRLALSVTDARTVDGINELIDKMKVERVALHPQPS